MSQRRTNIRLTSVISFTPNSTFLKGGTNINNISSSSSRQNISSTQRPVTPSIIFLDQKHKRINKVSYSQSKVRSTSRKGKIKK
ncbi:MAG: hypothetical protein MJ252_27465 [archaeon]|nr:hypothetical protein [archaeon]